MAHASFMSAVPADGAVVNALPKTLPMSFSEPVSPLVLRLAPDFTATTPREVTFVLSNMQADIKPMRRKAILEADGVGVTLTSSCPAPDDGA